MFLSHFSLPLSLKSLRACPRVRVKRGEGGIEPTLKKYILSSSWVGLNNHTIFFNLFFF